MDSTLTGAWIGAVAGLVLWILNTSWLVYSEHRKAKRVRTMIKVEINDNLEHLGAFIALIERTARGHAPGSTLHIIARHDALRHFRLQPWNRRVWNSLTESIPLALNPHEIETVYFWYNQLEELARIEEQRTAFASEAEWATTFETLIQQILASGSPLDTKSAPKFPVNGRSFASISLIW